jgi:hypothetical protein
LGHGVEDGGGTTPPQQTPIWEAATLKIKALQLAEGDSLDVSFQGLWPK